MAKFSRDKGKRFERRIAKIIRERWPQLKDEIRRSIQSREAEESDVTGLPGFWLECQDAATPTPAAKLEQAIGDSEDGTKGMPVAITHKTKTRTIEVSLRLADLLALAHKNDAGYGSVWSHRVQIDLETFLKLVEDGNEWGNDDE